MTPLHEREALRELAVRLAEEAGGLLASFAGRRSELVVDTKTSVTDPVSEADRASERLIAEQLLAARPDDGLLGEEDQASRAGTSGLRWVVDPLDGTVNFLYGIPAWCVSVAVEDDEGPLAGAVHHPGRGETFHAARGAGAACGRDTLAVTGTADLQHSLVATGFAYDRDVRADQAVDAGVLLGDVRDIRRCGAAALDLAWTAAGRLDAYVEFGLQPWDWAAGRLLVTEAGGRVSEHERMLGGQRRTGIVAGGRAAHDHLVAWLDRPRGRE
jgi:myo-inositol-1(or 4)-monophosphatase